MFRNKTLEGILSSFDRLAVDLSHHVSKKCEEQFELLVDKAFIEDSIKMTSDEIDRAHRVLAKVQDLVA